MSSFIFSSFIPRLFRGEVNMTAGYSLMLLNSVPNNATTTFTGAINGTAPAPTVPANIVIDDSSGTIIRPSNQTYLFAQNSNITALGVLLYKHGSSTATVEFPVAYFHFGQPQSSTNGDFSVTITQFITVS